MKQYVARIMACCLAVTQVFGFDAQNFYRPTLMQSIPRQVSTKPTTSVEVRLAQGSAHHSFGKGGKSQALLSSHGAFDLVRLGSNQDFTARPLTAAFWGTGKNFADLSAIGSNDGKFDVAGRFSTTDLAIQVQQSLFSGFYVQLYVPFRSLSLHDIALKNLGSHTVKTVDMANFISNLLPGILKENGIQGGLTAPVKKMGIGDPVVFGGWEASTKRLAPLVTDVAGYMQVGASIPAAARKDANYIFDIPRGYNGHFGLIGRAAAEACFFGLVTLGAQAGSTSFFSSAEKLRLQTDKAQNGWLVLTSANVKESQGSIWDFSGYLSVDKIVKGLRAMVGYSFTRQEATTYSVKDADYLKKFITDQAALPFPNFIAQNDYANSDTRLKPWEMQALQAALRLDTRELFDTAFSCLASLEISVPFDGKRAWKTTMTAGSIGASVALNF